MKRVTDGLSKVNSIFEAYLANGEISQEDKWIIAEFWHANLHTNDLIDYVKAKAVESPDELYNQTLALQSQLKRNFDIRDSNKKKYFHIKLRGKKKESWGNTMNRSLECLDMDLFDYVIQRYDGIANALMLDLDEYHNNNCINEPKTE